ncbi:MAG TPA: phage tail family protein [Clostridia bacterium]|nr:phage tail family protein [Clostridia bacterium]
MFDKARFDKTQFDKTSSRVSILYATIAAQFGLVAGPLRALVDIGETSINVVSSMVPGSLKMLVPIPGVSIGAEVGVSARLSILLPLKPVAINAETALIVQAMRTEDSDEIILNGVNLAPGQTLIIDTDSLDILINGEQNVDCWQLGSTFFKLNKGNNELRFYDNAADRELAVTVLWADRYK